MFDRFILASDYKRIREKYDQASLPEGEKYVPNFNISPDDSAYILKSELTFNPARLDMPPSMQKFYEDKVPTRAIRKFKFGLMGVEKSTTYFIRSEGNRNLNNDPYYTGAKAIFLGHKYKQIIRNQRCLCLADAFIVGIDKKPYLVYLRNDKKAFGMAGLWNVTEDKNGLKTHSFGILTAPANPLLKRLGCDRMPVIINERNERRWLSKSSELSQVLSMLNTYPYNLMNAYPISDKIRDKENNSLEVIQPVGSRIYSERFVPLSHRRVKAERDNNNLPGWGDMATKQT